VRTGDYNQCIKEYNDMIARYPADFAAHNQRAICLGKLQDMKGAVEEMRQVVQILPNHIVYRANLAVFLNYSGDFTGAEQEVGKLQAPNAYGVGALAFSQLGQGRVGEAAETYKKLTTMGAFGEMFGTAGLGDIAVYEGRFSDAVRIFEDGIKADLAGKNRDAAGLKLTALAHAHLSRNQKAQAAAAARRALENSTVAPIRVLAARIFAQTGDIARAKELAAEFTSRLGVENQAYGKIIEGNIALASKNPVQAIQILTEANKTLDMWLGHFDLGRAYFEAEGYLAADSEFETCIRRRGEALAVVQEDPTYGYLPMAYYYLGRVRQENGAANFADPYREYLKIRGQSTQDPLVTEVRGRAGN
jgi:tetratricopeptide (TPR) repeat protein